MAVVQFTCMTTKKKFEVENPEVVVLKNGRYAFCAACPWEGKNGKFLKAFKFCSKQSYDAYARSEHIEEAESEHIEEAEGEHIEEA